MIGVWWGIFFVTLWPSYHAVLSYRKKSYNIQWHCLWNPMLQNSKHLQDSLETASAVFSQQRQQVSLSHTSIRLYHVLHLHLWKRINTDSNNSTLDANFSETIIQIANYNKGPKQRQRKAIPSAHLKWVPGYLDANFYDTEQKKRLKTAFYRFVQN